MRVHTPPASPASKREKRAGKSSRGGRGRRMRQASKRIRMLKVIQSVCGGDIKSLKSLIESNDTPSSSSEDLVNVGDTHGRTPLMYAAQEGNIDIIKYLMEAKANINQTDSNSNMSPLLYAISHGRQAAVEVLLQAEHIDLRSEEFGRSVSALASSAIAVAAMAAAVRSCGSYDSRGSSAKAATVKNVKTKAGRDALEMARMWPSIRELLCRKIMGEEAGSNKSKEQMLQFRWLGDMRTRLKILWIRLRVAIQRICTPKTSYRYNSLSKRPSAISSCLRLITYCRPFAAETQPRHKHRYRYGIKTQMGNVGQRVAEALHDKRWRTKSNFSRNELINPQKIFDDIENRLYQLSSSPFENASEFVDFVQLAMSKLMNAAKFISFSFFWVLMSHARKYMHACMRPCAENKRTAALGSKRGLAKAKRIGFDVFSTQEDMTIAAAAAATKKRAHGVLQNGQRNGAEDSAAATVTEASTESTAAAATNPSSEKAVGKDDGKDSMDDELGSSTAQPPAAPLNGGRSGDDSDDDEEEGDVNAPFAESELRRRKRIGFIRKSVANWGWICHCTKADVGYKCCGVF
eukprot:jgi/Bigna1/77474/fgenesh1_pg.48_\